MKLVGTAQQERMAVAGPWRFMSYRHANRSMHQPSLFWDLIEKLTPMNTLPQIKSYWTIAALGVFSGILSGLAPEIVGRVALLDVPIHPGILFGLVIAFAVIPSTHSGWGASIVALVVTVAA